MKNLLLMLLMILIISCGDNSVKPSEKYIEISELEGDYSIPGGYDDFSCIKIEDNEYYKDSWIFSSHKIPHGQAVLKYLYRKNNILTFVILENILYKDKILTIKLIEDKVYNRIAIEVKHESGEIIFKGTKI